MLRSVKELEKCTIGATDGVIGRVEDFYFDDVAWVIRYLVVNTGAWLSNRHVLISPHAIRGWGPEAGDGRHGGEGREAREGAVLPVSLSREQVRQSPDVDLEKPVSRQYELSYFGYYGYPYYWSGDNLWGADCYPGIVPIPDAVQVAAEAETRKHQDPHLRSCNAVAGYDLRAADGAIGHVASFVIDEESWAIRFLIVDTSNWWIGHQVLIAPEWIESVSWVHASVNTALTRQAVKDSPPYDPGSLLDSRKEAALYSHYGRSAYGSRSPHRPAAELPEGSRL
jgi:hypothetical protein